MPLIRSSVRIVEVGPRDGLQNISQVVPTALKIQLIERLAACGNSTIEATSFVSPKAIPQLSDARSVLQGIEPLTRATSINFPVLVPTLNGLDSAIQSNVKEIAVFLSTSEGFSKKNINCTVDESLQQAREVVTRAIGMGIRVRGYVSCIFSCPFDGPIDPSAVLRITAELLSMGCYEVSLGDTVGVGTTADVHAVLSLLLQTLKPHQLAGHFHDTYGQAVANVMKAYEMGLRVFDSSVAGLGGCPYAPGAKGNLASEDIVYAFHRCGIQTGIDLERLADTGSWISQELRIPNNSRAGAALAAKKKNVLESSKMQHKVGRRWTKIQSEADFSVYRSAVDVKIVMTRPKVGNTLTIKMLHGLTNLFDTLSQDPKTFHIAITGEGKYFCTGMDLSANGSVTEGDSEVKEIQFQALLKLFEAIDHSPQVTIAMINGPCYGGGIGLAFACDIRLVTATTTFTLSEAKLGLAPAVISKWVVREWGRAVAREAMLTARPVTASELNRIGVVHSLARDVEALESTLEIYLDRAGECAPRASKLCKDLVRVEGNEQTNTIKKIFDEMMRPSPEAAYGVEQFRLGIRPVKWQECISRGPTKL